MSGGDIDLCLFDWPLTPTPDSFTGQGNKHNLDIFCLLFHKLDIFCLSFAASALNAALKTHRLCMRWQSKRFLLNQRKYCLLLFPAIGMNAALKTHLPRRKCKRCQSNELSKSTKLLFAKSTERCLKRRLLSSPTFLLCFETEPCGCVFIYWICICSNTRLTTTIAFYSIQNSPAGML